MIINRQYDCRNPLILPFFFHMGGIWVERHDLRSQASFHHSAIRLALVFLRAPVSSNFGTSNSLNRQFSLFKDVKMTIFLGMDGYGMVYLKVYPFSMLSQPSQKPNGSETIIQVTDLCVRSLVKGLWELIDEESAGVRINLGLAG